MKRILGISSVIGMISVTAWLIYSFVTNFGNIFPNIPKLENANYPKVEGKVEGKVEFPKVELGDPELPDQPLAPLPAEAPIPSSEPDSSFSPQCDPFGGMDLSLVILSLREDIMVQTLYLKTDGDVIPGLVPADDTQPTNYYALLGDIKSNSCGFQLFDDRLYCMFTITSDMQGTVADFFLYRDDCEEPAFTMLNVTIPVDQPSGDEKPLCNRDLGLAECDAAGGEIVKDAAGLPFCSCD